MELNLPVVHEAIAAAIPDRECLVHRGRRWTWAEVTERSRRFAGALHDRGIGVHAASAGSAGWESPHDHVALYLRNGPEYLEAMLGTMKARAAAVNVNYRYVAEELVHLMADSGSRVVVHHLDFAPTLAAVLPRLDGDLVLVHVDDGSGRTPLAGSVAYEDLLAEAAPELPGDLVSGWSGDDLYLLYTGGTTGSPKGVCWRQADFLVAALGLRRPDGTDYEAVAEIVDRARGGTLRALPSAPFMHGAAHWNAISAWLGGGTVIIQDRVDRLDPADVLRTCERERVSSLLIVGDAFARPLVDELRRGAYDLGALRFVLTGGAVLGAPLKQALLELVPGLRIVDVLGSSETGRQGVSTVESVDAIGAGRFAPSPTTEVLSDDLSRVLEPGDPELGWLGQRGRMPRGYLGDPEKTAATFPVLDGVRFAVPGDRARRLADGSVELHGRESVTINTGGEKVFAEEVESALKTHPDVLDAVVVGRPSERWGQEVVAVVSLRPGSDLDADALREVCAAHLARYKLPKAVVVREHIERSPAGKADYRWARAQVL